jgi:DegV family protein with EDD domain
MKYKLIADSSCDFCPTKAVDFISVPLTIRTDEKEFVDDANLQVADMLEYLQNYKGKSSSACPGVGEYLDAFGDADRVIVITITSGLSGSYNAAVQAANTYMEEHPDKKVFILDSLSAGPEPFLMVEKAEELMAEGMEFEEICTALKDYKEKTRLTFSLESVTNFARNGRVSPVVAKMVGLLGIRLVGQASDEGTLEPLHKCRGEKKALEKIVEVMTELGYNGGKVRIAHCFNEVAAKLLKSDLIQKFKDADIRIHTCGGLCSFYAEQGGLLVGFES